MNWTNLELYTGMRGKETCATDSPRHSLAATRAMSLSERRTMLRYGLRYGMALAASIGAIGWSQQSAIAQSAAARQAAGPSFIVAASDSNSSIARARSTKSTRQPPAQATEAIPPLPERKDGKNASAKGAEPAPDVWQPQEIAAAQARCAAILKEIDAVVIPQPPLKQGQCGAPAPVRLVSVGKSPQVAFSPPALVDCKLAAALHAWIKNDLQPLAAKHLGAKIIAVEVMSDYSCRPALGRVGNRLSEHAFANALDIRGFLTEKGQAARVLQSWGTPKREIAERIAAAKAQAEKDAAARAAADAAAKQNLQDPKATQDAKTKPADKTKAATAPVAVATNLATPGAGVAKRIRAGGVDKIAITLPGSSKGASQDVAKLGGPRTPGPRNSRASTEIATLGPIEEPPPGPQSHFLHAAHAAGCRIFGTTLGPEANADHRNHFHVDMAERKYKKICD